MKIVVRAAVLGALLVAFVAGTAGAQDPYSNPQTPVLPASDEETPRGERCDEQNGGPENGGFDESVCEEEQQGEVLPSDAEAEADPAEVPSGGGAVAEVTPAAPAAAISDTPAPSGSLPLTGGDVVGMTVMGVAALGIGAVLVRRSKAMRRVAA